MIDSNTQERLIRDFRGSRGKYSDLANTLESLLSTLIQGGGYTVHSISSRCKTEESFARKLTLPGKSYADLASITDITGLRITTYFSEDVDAVAKIVEAEFAVDPSHSVDKRQALDPDRFGYQSLHYVAALQASRCALGEYRRFEGMKFEIQIRSILQHAWAEIEHDLGYKSAMGVPREIRRRFARIAGLLELADAEFSAIRSDLASYSEKILADIANANANDAVELNLPSLRALYGGNSTVRSLDDVIAKVAGSQIAGAADDIDGIELQWLQRMGIGTTGALEQAAHSQHDELSRFADYWLGGACHVELPISIGLFYLTYLLLSKTQDKNFILEYCTYCEFLDPKDIAAKILAYPQESAA